MKKFSLNKKTKIISLILASTIFLSVFLYFSYYVFKNNSKEIKEEIEIDEYQNLDIINSIKKTNLKVLLDENQNNKFSQKSIESNIYKVLKQAIDNSDDWKNENTYDYSFKIRFNLNENRNNLQINLFLYNKLIKNKKFKSSIMIGIV